MDTNTSKMLGQTEHPPASDHPGAETGVSVDARLDDQQRERQSLLALVEDWLEKPMLVLGLIWLALLVVDLVWGLTAFLEALGLAIWVTFVLDFVLRFALAPQKSTYLRRNWLTAIALLVPALRVFRFARVVSVLRAGRAARGVRMLRVLTSVNRGMRALGASMARRGLGYVLALTVIVGMAGAAGVYAFERDVPGSHVRDFGSAVWWTAMVLTTMGSEYWPRSVEGRVLCLFLATYAFAVFGYVTAALASYFVGRDAAQKDGEIAGQDSIQQLQNELSALRAELRTFATRNSSGPGPRSASEDAGGNGDPPASS